MKSIGFIVIFTVILYGCGGGGENTTSVTPPQQVSVTISPANIAVFDQTTTQFTATVIGTANAGVAWSVQDGGGSVSSDGKYTAPSIAGTYEIKATSTADSTKFATSKIVVSKVSVVAEQQTATIAAKQAIQLSASISGDQNKEVKWSVKDSPGAGEISQTGLYRAPSTAGVFQVIATSAADPRKFATITVTVTASSPDTSYLNYKEAGLIPKSLPERQDARAFIDLNNDGILDYVTAALTYWGKPFSEATPADLRVWLGTASGEWVTANNVLPPNLDCLHPRKIAVADYNQDGRKDLFFACHGYDAAPFPGEKNIVILSSINGYVMRPANDDVGFFHATSSADVNFDGYPDVVVVNNFDQKASVITLINNRDGTFSKNYPMSPSNIGSKGYFSVELVDIDDDGLLDLIVGGHDWEGAPTAIYINQGTYDFSKVTPVLIPAIPNEGVVLDFTVTRDLGQTNIWINRTSGGDGTFYESHTIQKFTWPQKLSSVVYSSRPKQWQPWLIPATVDGQAVITTDNLNDAFKINRQ